MTALHPPRSLIHDTTSMTAASDCRPILVVDDDPMLRRLVAMALRREGFEVVEAADGEGALEHVAARVFALVLLDGQLPGLSGRQVLERLRADARTATLPVLMLTADSALVDRLSGLAAGADDYLTKPFSLEEVVARVRAHLRAHDAWVDTLTAHERQRSALARALEAASRQSSLEGAAGVLCNALASQAGVRTAALVRFTASRHAVPVAICGENLWGLAINDPVPVPMRRYLYARATSGPWLERGDPAGFVRPPALVATGTRVACAPFGETPLPGEAASLAAVPARLHGVLLLELADDALVDPSAALAAAIDFAAVVNGLLRPRLLEQHRAELDRMELRSVLREHAFRPHFQPIVDLITGDIVGAEALTRFSDGARPDVRFREAAVAGLGIDLELATLAAAVDEARALFPRSAWLSLNVSPALMLSAASRSLHDLLDLRDRDVVLELSEQEAVSDYEAMRAAMNAAGDGVRLSIDDAGSGFASLRHILKLKPDFIKLDRSWIHGVDTDPARQAMIAGLRHFADQTGAILVAEGIERVEEQMVLVDLRVELGQGYLLGRPAALSPA